MISEAERLASDSLAGQHPDGPPDHVLQDTPLVRARWMRAEARAFAVELDDDAAFPVQSLARLCQLNLLTAPLPTVSGGEGLATEETAALTLCGVLRAIGGASLPLGRLYEGHVNAIVLLCRYGTPAQVEAVAAEIRCGMLLGVWNTEKAEGLRLIGDERGGTLHGGKTFASGAGYIQRPIVTARSPSGVRLMIMPRLPIGCRTDMAAWMAHGMRASATGNIDLSGLIITPEEIIGGDGDYHREPLFSAGAWRFAAVQSGAIAYIFDLLRQHLRSVKRDKDPHQLMRVGQAALLVEGARQWVEKAACFVADKKVGSNEKVAFVNLARLAVEQAGLEVMQLAQRSIGLAGFMRTHPLEQACRDLATYLRQPSPDLALTRAAEYVLAAEGDTDTLW